MMPMPCSLRFSLRTLSVVQILVLALLSGPAIANQEALSPYGGQWARVEDDAADEARIASIESATRDLSWLVRKMANGALSKSALPAGELTFAWDGDQMRQHVRGPNGEYDRLVDLDGGPTRHTGTDGEETTIEWRQTAEGLEIHWAHSQAFGRNLYRVDPSSQTLHVEHRLQVTAIDGVDEIVYGSRFERQALPAISAAPPDQMASGGPIETD